MQRDSLRPQPLLSCHRAWLLVKQRVQRQAKPMQVPRLVMLLFELSCVHDVLPAKAPRQAIRLE
jgi:hypothetical protein